MSLSSGSAAARFTPPVPHAIRPHLRVAACVTGLTGGVVVLAAAYGAGLAAPWLLAPALIVALLLGPVSGHWPRPVLAAAVAGGVAAGALGAAASPAAAPLSAVLLLAIASAIAARAERSGPLACRTLWPVAFVAALAATLFGFATLLGVDPELAGWIAPLSLVAVAVAQAEGALRTRAFAAGALERLGGVLSARPDLPEVRRGLSLALRDRELTVRWRAAGASVWTDDHGRPADPPAPERGRMLTTVVPAGGGTAVVVHDADLERDPALLDAVRAHVATALDNRRLVDQLQGSLEDLSTSRARLLTVADEERRLIERDLHDGAQQRLVVLRIKMELLADELETQAPEGARRLRDLEGEIVNTLEAVRSIGRGAYPPLLADRGLGDALRAMARNAPVATTVGTLPSRRYPPVIEGAVYFTCVEALQNAMKHSGAEHIRIAVTDGGSLRFEVRDDGAGFDVAGACGGTGLAHMRDRVGAVGGELDIASVPGRGTVVKGTIPLPAAVPLAQG